ncbi:MAG: hypothetical protein KF708_11245 [Pirellulales bacterium]|nr:hypothetical protein [Pirellulales bacterium]
MAAMIKRSLVDCLVMFVGTCLPVIVVSQGYHEWLGHRSDYVGHFLAGAGATLFVLALALGAIPAIHFPRVAVWMILALTLLAIAGGGVLEATIYRLAKFDEVDFCNQSLGAVMAGLGMMALVRSGERRGATGNSGLGDLAAELASAPPSKPVAALVGAALFGLYFLKSGYHYAFL